jgi:hypothetical protein
LLEDIRQTYLLVDERKTLDELTRPKEVKGHEPGQPLEMPSRDSRATAPPGVGPIPPPPPGGNPPPPAININPGQRSIERQER